MVEVTIRGKKFPLCLTAAALDQINAKCGGLTKIEEFLDGGKGETQQNDRAMSNTAWMLGLLIVEGEENRLVAARFDGETTERRAVPDSEALSHLLTFAEARSFRPAVFKAINESLTQDIEAEPSKNGESAEQG